MLSDNPSAGILVIGDEILSGRTREGNAHYLAGVLAATGFDLREIRVIPDDHATIVAALQAMDRTLGGTWDHVFTSGGIGPTHDDITADAVAEAFGTVLEIHPDAREAMAARYASLGIELNDNRLRMARVPVGARLIVNSVSAAPGFSIGVTHVMAGVPNVFRAMVEAVLPTLQAGRPQVSETLEMRRGESDVAADLGEVAEAYSDLSLGSYPFHDEDGWGTNLVVRGVDAARVSAAMAELKSRLGVAG
ncbi:competence/damage-inducible protein A [Paracoccus suum]|uniref:Competence/damage-inducible protein A n=1 Tax=Paracoccus suum TaxID=2259340 RepID=A0A344PGT4_9RHOB|nr:molybdopterin-binding protein [Paracoccus suum]AXC48589.1 competence/damage-inducible protein A [Paracoccus suum]